MQSITDDIDEEVRSLFEPMTHHQQIDKLEDAMRAIPERCIDIPVKHVFSPGIYAREIVAPKGSTITGKIHKYECLNVVSKGKIEVVTEEGRKIIEAPAIFTSAPGTRRAAYIHEETVWTTFHATNETDITKLEEDLVVGSVREFVEFQRMQACISEGESA